MESLKVADFRKKVGSKISRAQLKLASAKAIVKVRVFQPDKWRYNVSRSLSLEGETAPSSTDEVSGTGNCFNQGSISAAVYGLRSKTSAS